MPAYICSTKDFRTEMTMIDFKTQKSRQQNPNRSQTMDALPMRRNILLTLLLSLLVVLPAFFSISCNKEKPVLPDDEEPVVDSTMTTLKFRNAGPHEVENLQLLIYGSDGTRQLETLLRFDGLPDSVEDRTSRESWPQMPLGQAMWALLADRSLAPLVQAWASGIVSETIRNTPSCVTFCPEHPETLYEAGNVTLKCGNKGCNLEYCPACAAWHQRNSCQHRWDGPKCPHCQAPTVKAGGCNHITCQRCHGHWCYYCEAGFKTANDCYQHMGHAHHWDERPSWSLRH